MTGQRPELARERAAAPDGPLAERTALPGSAGTTLHDWPAPDAAQDALRHTFLAFLDASGDACLRRHAPGHLTASTLVTDPDATRVLLTLHPRVGRWIQLG